MVMRVSVIVVMRVLLSVCVVVIGVTVPIKVALIGGRTR